MTTLTHSRFGHLSLCRTPIWGYLLRIFGAHKGWNCPFHTTSVHTLEMVVRQRGSDWEIQSICGVTSSQIQLKASVTRKEDSEGERERVTSIKATVNANRNTSLSLWLLNKKHTGKILSNLWGLSRVSGIRSVQQGVDHLTAGDNKAVPEVYSGICLWDQNSRAGTASVRPPLPTVWLEMWFPQIM